MHRKRVIVASIAALMLIAAWAVVSHRTHSGLPEVENYATPVQYIENLRKLFPKGTDIGTVINGAAEADASSIHRCDDKDKTKRICVSKLMWKERNGVDQETTTFIIVFDNDGKLLSIEEGESMARMQ